MKDVKYKAWVASCVLLIVASTSRGPREQTPFPVDANAKDIKLVAHIGGEPPISMWASQIEVQEHYAYAGFTSELAILDVSDPTRPTQVGQFVLPDRIEDLVVAGGYAYVADGQAGLYIVNISDPTHPSLVSIFDQAVSSLDAASGFIYVIDGQRETLSVIDVSNPLHPLQAGSYSIEGRVLDVTVAGEYAYIASVTEGLWILDVSTPHHITQVGHDDTPRRAISVAVENGYAYVAADRALHILDVSDPAAPIQVGSYPVPDQMASIEQVTVAGNHVYVIDDYDGLILDISDPSNPVEIWHRGRWWRGENITISDGYAYIIERHDEVRIIDISDPTAPTLAGLYKKLEWVNSVAVAGDYAYVGDDRGLRVLDVSKPNRPTQVGYAPLLNGAEDIFIVGRYAYVASYGGLRIVDVSDPAAPVQVGTWGYGGTNANDVVVRNNYAHVAVGTTYPGGSSHEPIESVGRLAIIDVSDPTAPEQVGSLDAPGHARGVTLVGQHAYVGWGACVSQSPHSQAQGGIQIIDVANPTAPIEVNSFAMPGIVRQTVLQDGYVYAIWESPCYPCIPSAGGLTIFDVSAPAAPLQVAVHYDSTAYASALALEETGLFVGLGDCQRDNVNWDVRAIDVSNPVAPVEVGSYKAPGYAQDIAVQGNDVYIAAGRKGLYILCCTGHVERHSLDITFPTNT